MKMHIVTFLLLAVAFHQVLSMNVGANFPSELSQDRSDQQLIIDFESESLENEDDDGDLGNLVVISLNRENTFEVLKISSELEAEILAQAKVDEIETSTEDLARTPKWLKKLGNFVKKVFKNVKVCVRPGPNGRPVLVFPCIKH